MIIKAKLPQGRLPTPAADAKQLPAAEPRVVSHADESAVFFRLFFSAVSHEVANSLQGLRAFDTDPKSGDCERITRDIILNFNRLRTLGGLSPAMDGVTLTREFALLFPDEGISADNLSAESKGALLKGLKIRALAELHSSLNEADPIFRAIAGTEEMKSNLNRALTYGKLLCGALEKIILGVFDLSSEIIPQKVLGRSSVLRALTSTAREAAVKIHLTEIEPSLFNTDVQSNPLFLRLIIANVYSNARRAIERTECDPHIRIFMNKEGDKAVIRFVDGGCGMDAETMGKLNCGIQTSTKPEAGHGIGFSYCRSLAEKLGGRLYVESSEPGRGTIVALELKASE
jgi:signal transduction histidine kinase